jgi:LmbE family N-acetylglucosaminyl deacetylase
MTKIIFGIFAHPDDESFGPSGTLLQETRSGSELHLITITNGSSGTNPDNHPNLGDIRLQEWHNAGTLIGASGMHHLGYSDGNLNNKNMIEIGEKIIDIVLQTIKNVDIDTEIEFMSMDTNGITGHIDHIVAARATLWVFYKLKHQDPRFKQTRLACISEAENPSTNIDWLYMEKGRPEAEIDETVDATQLRQMLIEIIRTHKSQRNDGESHIKNRGDQLGIDHFIVKK